MTYPETIEEKLGFDQIKEKVASLCKLSISTDRARKLRFITERQALEQSLKPVDEFISLIDRKAGVPAMFDSDLSQVLAGLNVVGNFLEGDQLIRVAKAIRGFDVWNTFAKKEQEHCPEIARLISDAAMGLYIPKFIEERIEEAGGVKDGASDDLRKIRRSLRSASSSARNSLSRIFRETDKKGYVPDGLNISVRDGRLVIPVLAEHKRHLQGLIHDESASGQTVYIEPAEILEMNNRIRELQIEERKEVVRVLMDISEELRRHNDDLTKVNNAMGELDLAHAKSRYASQINGIVPVFDNSLILEQARHPLLIAAFAGSDRKVVPLSMTLSEQVRMLLISGPNAGGKSVCLKTVGLLQYMAQSALPVPVEPGSRFRVFDSIFVDMGDEQSIENDLSTYSSHLHNLKVMLESTSANSMLLIDEFGTGTDPQFGGALAQAVLEGLLKTGTFGVITTHYSNLKEFSENAEGIENGSMRYDSENLRPLFKLDVGRPGNSFALEIAGNIGLPEQIIEKAKSIAGTDHVTLEKLIGNLAQEKQGLEERVRDVEAQEHRLEELTAQYKLLKAELENKKSAIVNKAREEAEQLLSETNREIEKTIRHIRENQAHKAETRRARERLEKVKSKVRTPKGKSVTVAPPEVAAGPIMVGDIVTISNGNMKGEVLAIKNGVADVSVGSLKTSAPVSALTRVGRASSQSQRPSKKGFDMVTKKAHFKSEIDVRGRRAEVAIMEVDKFIDDAMLAGTNEVRILHGKGDGILRQVIREHLRDYPYLESIQDAHIEMGGAGISVIKFK